MNRQFYKTSFNTATPTQVNHRGQRIVIDSVTGQRIKNKPVNKLEDCFIIESISWKIDAIHVKTGKPVEIQLASGIREKEIRKSKDFIFEK